MGFEASGNGLVCGDATGMVWFEALRREVAILYEVFRVSVLDMYAIGEDIYNDSLSRRVRVSFMGVAFYTPSGRSL